MYSTCTFCNKPLGTNEVFEIFPVGRRIAFDSARGRLWVVCRSCERWNLSPLEERWEIVEECERAFSSTRIRTSTEQIGLARLREGLVLVRIGAPLRPEFAAWRYGDQFGRRRRNAYIRAGLVVGAVGAASVGLAATGVGVLTIGQLALQGTPHLIKGRPKKVVAVLAHGRELIQLKRFELRSLTMATDGDVWGLSVVVGSESRRLTFEGEEAEMALRQVLPAVNRFAGKAADVNDAVRMLEENSPAKLPAYATINHTPVITRFWFPPILRQYIDSRVEKEVKEIMKNIMVPVRDPDAPFPGFTFGGKADLATLTLMPYATRLALEMATHEEAERRALEGELAVLEEAWRQAEEIANISDNLLLPDSLTDKLRGMR